MFASSRSPGPRSEQRSPSLSRSNTALPFNLPVSTANLRHGGYCARRIRDSHCPSTHDPHEHQEPNRQLPQGSREVEKLGAIVDRVDRHIDEVEKLLKTFRSVVPPEISTIFNETFSAVRDTLESTDASMEGSFSIAFAGGSSVMGKIHSKALRMFQATKLNDEVNSVEAKMDKASNLLLHLTTNPVIARQLQEHQDVTRVSCRSIKT